MDTNSVEGQCLNQQLDDAISACEAWAGESITSVWDFGINSLGNKFDVEQWDSRDDCLRSYFMGIGTGNFGNFSSNTGVAQYINYFPGSKYFGSQSGYIFFDRSCNPVQSDAVNALDDGDDIVECLTASIYAKTSPISLILGESVADWSKTSSISSFPLNPSKIEGAAYEWKASEKAPLLVWTPEGRDEVTSAKQLFGEYAFGGKQVASLSGEIKEQAKWNDGYEALGSLDRNQDGEISGSELENLSLWFDEGRDGVFEKSELRSLASVGIRKLFYKGHQADPTGDLVLEAGFERVVDGELVKGTSVDWYGEEAPTRGMLLNRWLAKTALSGGETKESALVENIEEVPEIKEDVSKEAKLKSSTELSGLWTWQTKVSGANRSDEFGGILHFDAHVDGTLELTSYLESSVGINENRKKLVMIERGEGAHILKDNGVIALSFELSSGDDGKAKISSKGTYYPELEEIKGRTTVAKSENGLVREITYKWIAKRRTNTK